MSDSLRDQLLGLGFKPNSKPKPKTSQSEGARRGEVRRSRSAAPSGARSEQKKQRPTPARTSRAPAGEIDLAKAYAIRAQREKDERIQAEQQKQEAARQRRAAKAQLAQFLEDKALNTPEADIARHFSYGGKIKRIYVTSAQLQQLNTGLLGVVQLNGGYLLVDVATLKQAEEIFAPAIALKVDSDAASKDDPDPEPSSDPKHQIPDDLVW